mmetsp:Transcript_62138/g.138428  ORF Transcript_62138/g.138428 Transcript_62138/m.138428 type:complete len:203 (+) Transcript_62138:466-1074(+)
MLLQGFLRRPLRQPCLHLVGRLSRPRRPLSLLCRSVRLCLRLSRCFLLHSRCPLHLVRLTQLLALGALPLFALRLPFPRRVSEVLTVDCGLSVRAHCAFTHLECAVLLIHFACSFGTRARWRGRRWLHHEPELAQTLGVLLDVLQPLHLKVGQLDWHILALRSVPLVPSWWLSPWPFERGFVRTISWSCRRRRSRSCRLCPT